MFLPDAVAIVEVDKLRPRVAVSPDGLPHGARVAVLPGDAYHLETVRAPLLVDRDEAQRVAAARPAPRGPKVDKRHTARQQRTDALLATVEARRRVVDIPRTGAQRSVASYQVATLGCHRMCRKRRGVTPLEQGGQCVVDRVGLALALQLFAHEVESHERGVVLGPLALPGVGLGVDADNAVVQRVVSGGVEPALALQAVALAVERIEAVAVARRTGVGVIAPHHYVQRVEQGLALGRVIRFGLAEPAHAVVVGRKAGLEPCTVFGPHRRVLPAQCAV